MIKAKYPLSVWIILLFLFMSLTLHFGNGFFFHIEAMNHFYFVCSLLLVLCAHIFFVPSLLTNRKTVNKQFLSNIFTKMNKNGLFWKLFLDVKNKNKLDNQLFYSYCNINNKKINRVLLLKSKIWKSRKFILLKH